MGGDEQDSRINHNGVDMAKKPRVKPEPPLEEYKPEKGEKIGRAKIAILGTTPSRFMAPIDDPEWQIWTIGPGGKDAHKDIRPPYGWDMLFEIHRTWPEDFAEYLNDLSNVKLPQRVVTLVPMKEAIKDWAAGHGKDPEWLDKTITGDWQANVVMNREELFGKFLRKMWFSSSISYCLAMAMAMNPEQIALFGIDLESGEEYISQFMGAAHLIDVARDRGIPISMPKGCGLLRDLEPYPDRYETIFATYTEQKMGYIQGLLNDFMIKREQAKLDLYRAEGALLTIQQHLADKKELLAEAEGRVVAGNGARMQAEADYWRIEGERGAMEHMRRLFVFGNKELME